MNLAKFAVMAFLGWQAKVLVGEHLERGARYRDAQWIAMAHGKPLLVVGGPAAGASQNPLVQLLRIPHHGCGDVCLDIDVTTCRICGKKVEKVEADVRAIPYPNKYFGCAFISHVLEHLSSIEDCKTALKELYRVADRVIIVSPSKQDVIAWLHPGHHLWVRQTPGGVHIQQR